MPRFSRCSTPSSGRASTRRPLLAHLRQEDRELYPVLEAAKGDSQRTGRQFGAEMRLMSEGVLAFFAKYADGGEGLELARDYGRLVGLLRSRIRNEELILYPTFDKLTAQSKLAE